MHFVIWNSLYFKVKGILGTKFMGSLNMHVVKVTLCFETSSYPSMTNPVPMYVCSSWNSRCRRSSRRTSARPRRCWSRTRTAAWWSGSAGWSCTSSQRTGQRSPRSQRPVCLQGKCASVAALTCGRRRKFLFSLKGKKHVFGAVRRGDRPFCVTGRLGKQKYLLKVHSKLLYDGGCKYSSQCGLFPVVSWFSLIIGLRNSYRT